MDDSDKTAVLPQDQNDPKLPPSDELPPGTRIGSYIALNIISSGGQGSVYRARHSLLPREVAIKVLRAELANSRTTRQRFFQEASSVNIIKHANIVDVFELGELPDGRPYMVMEYLEGIDLKSVITASGRMDPETALSIIEPICQALDAAHRAGFVHRDVKANNIHIAVARNGQDMRARVKLLDFGIAKALQTDPEVQGLTVAGSRLGTSASIAPEQILGTAITPQTDIYALGVLLFRMLAGRNPFEADTAARLDFLHLQAPPPNVSQFAPVSPLIDAVILKAMQKDAANRFNTAIEFLNAYRISVKQTTEPDAVNVVRVVGVYVDVRVPDDADDDGLDDQISCLEISEATFVEHGFSIALQTGTMLLGLQQLPPGADSKSVCTAALGVAEMILLALKERDGASPAVSLAVSIHVDECMARSGTIDLQVSGGSVLLVSNWAPQCPQDTVFTTPVAAEELGAKAQ